MHTSLWLVVLSMIESFGVIGNRESGVVSHNWRQKRKERERENQAERVSGGTDVRYDISSLTLLLFTWPILPNGQCSLVVSVIKLKQVVSGRKRRILGWESRGKRLSEGEREGNKREGERGHVVGVNCVSFITFLPSFSSLSSLFLSSFCLSFLSFSPFQSRLCNYIRDNWVQWGWTDEEGWGKEWRMF